MRRSHGLALSGAILLLASSTSSYAQGLPAVEQCEPAVPNASLYGRCHLQMTQGQEVCRCVILKRARPRMSLRDRRDIEATGAISSLTPLPQNPVGLPDASDYMYSDGRIDPGLGFPGARVPNDPGDRHGRSSSGSGHAASDGSGTGGGVGGGSQGGSSSHGTRPAGAVHRAEARPAEARAEMSREAAPPGAAEPVLTIRAQAAALEAWAIIPAGAAETAVAREAMAVTFQGLIRAMTAMAAMSRAPIPVTTPITETTVVTKTGTMEGGTMGADMTGAFPDPLA